MEFLESLLDNAGTKIRKWAASFVLVEAIAAIIGGIYVMTIDEEYIIVGILTMIAGILVAWLTALFISAFGELVKSPPTFAKPATNS